MINVYTGTDTEEKFNVVQNDAPYDLDANNITRVDVYVCSPTAKLVSEEQRRILSNDAQISWVADVLTLVLGGLELLPGTYTANVIFYDAAHPDGFIITELSLNIRC